VVVYGDASGENAKTTGASDYQMVRDFFSRQGMQRVEYMVPRSNPAVRERISLVNSRLRNAAGGTTLSISPRCKELIKDFEEVAYKGDTTVMDKTRDLRRTHLSDALGYLIWQEWRPRAPAGERSHPLF
jgi:hypothetical protein